MKILLMGEYSNVHATLAEGLRKLGHEVTVLSNGDFWKNYPRDINMVRKPGKLGGILYLIKLYTIVHKLRGYDIVQLINPMFLELKAERIFPIYRYLRKYGFSVILQRENPYNDRGKTLLRLFFDKKSKKFLLLFCSVFISHYLCTKL